MTHKGVCCSAIDKCKQNKTQRMKTAKMSSNIRMVKKKKGQNITWSLKVIYK